MGRIVDINNSKKTFLKNPKKKPFFFLISERVKNEPFKKQKERRRKNARR